MIKAQIVADSKNQIGNRITSVLVTLPRIVLAELNTHRMLSRNSASSRAIPFKKMVETVKSNPFIPIAFQKDHKGMQGTEYFNNKENKILIEEWLVARDRAVTSAQELNWGIQYQKKEKIIHREGVTKQLCNRLLEPFMWHTVLITATEWENFFHQRCPQYTIPIAPEDNLVFRSWKDAMNNPLCGDFDTNDVIERLQYNTSGAEIHIQAAAEAIWDAMNESEPKQLQPGQWHIPYEDLMNSEACLEFVDHNNPKGLTIRQEIDQVKVKVSTGLCARTSYTKLGDDLKLDHKSNVDLHDRLVSPEYGHWSPLEHCAQSPSINDYEKDEDGVRDLWSGNFRGFIQYRKTFENENHE